MPTLQTLQGIQQPTNQREEVAQLAGRNVVQQPTNMFLSVVCLICWTTTHVPSIPIPAVPMLMSSHLPAWPQPPPWPQAPFQNRSMCLCKSAQSNHFSPASPIDCRVPVFIRVLICGYPRLKMVMVASCILA